MADLSDEELDDIAIELAECKIAGGKYVITLPQAEVESMMVELQRRRAEQAAGREHVERVVVEVMAEAAFARDPEERCNDFVARRVADRLSAPVESHLVKVARLADALPVDPEAEEACDRAMASRRAGKSRKLNAPTLSAEDVETLRAWRGRAIYDRLDDQGAIDVIDRLIAGAQP